mgnify:CR=1 FL=1
MIPLTNSSIARLLQNVANAYRIKDEKKFRFQIMAYQKAADTISSSTIELKDLYDDHRLESIDGVGPTIAQHITELFEKGKVAHFEEVFKGIPDSVFTLMEIPTFGPKKSFRLVMEFGLTDKTKVIEEVKKLAKSGKIAPLDGFGEKSQADMLVAIDEFAQGMGKSIRMSLPFAAELADQLIEYVKKSPVVENAFPLGSLRRRAATVGDIDIAVATHDPKSVIEHFTKYPYKQRVIEKGDVSASLLTSSGQQVDLIALEPKMLGSLLQHFTGSKNHNVQLREFALKQNKSLSERGIKDARNPQKAIQTYSTEEKFYQALGLDWIPPELREGNEEIELARTHTLPALIEVSDIRGDLHIHSSFPIEPSHDMGVDSMESMIQRALELKYEYIGFSEHNPSVSQHTKKQVVEILKKRNEHIDKLQEKYKPIHIIRLMETDILTNGQLALDEKALELLDATLVSIHSSFGMEKKAMTKRILSGLSHPKAKIFSHPTGRLLQKRNGYEVDFDQLLQYCAEQNKALEINSSPDRLDLSDTMVKQAVQNKVKMVINTDSHALDHMDLMKYGVWVARRGWSEKKDILNTLPAADFIRWIKHKIMTSS